MIPNYGYTDEHIEAEQKAQQEAEERYYAEMLKEADQQIAEFASKAKLGARNDI